MKTTSIRPPAPGAAPSTQSVTRSRITSRIWLRVRASRLIRSQSSLIGPAACNRPATAISTVRSARTSRPCWERLRRPRRSTLGSRLISTDLIRPSRASPPEAVQALYQTVRLCGRRSRSPVSTSRIRLDLPIPHPASMARVNGVEPCEARSSALSRAAVSRAPRRSCPASPTGSSLSSASRWFCCERRDQSVAAGPPPGLNVPREGVVGGGPGQLGKGTYGEYGDAYGDAGGGEYRGDCAEGCGNDDCEDGCDGDCADGCEGGSGGGGTTTPVWQRGP